MLRVRLRALDAPGQVVVPDLVNYGLLYNWYAATDVREITSAGDFVVPAQSQWNTLGTYLGGNSIAGAKLKETGFIYWSTPNLGATNDVGFNARGNGFRRSLGVFAYFKLQFSGWSSTINNATSSKSSWIGNNGITINTNDNAPIKSAIGIRLVRPATLAEQSQLDGTACANYVGNDGKIYRTVKIGTQVWLSSNLAETKFRNGDYIPGYDAGVYTPFTDAAWAALTTAGVCAYGDNTANI